MYCAVVLRQEERPTQAGPMRYRLLCTTNRPEEYGLSISSETELSVVGQVTTNRNQACEWFRRLVDGEARPCHLAEICEEFLCE